MASFRDESISSAYNARASATGDTIFSEVNNLSDDVRADYDRKLSDQHEAAKRYMDQLDVGRPAQVELAKREILNGQAIKAYPQEQRDEMAQLQAEQKVDANIFHKMEAMGDQHQRDRVHYLEGVQAERTQDVSTKFNREASFELGE